MTSSNHASYNPNHPDADWSGFVSKRTNRKHIQTQSDQLAPSIDGTSFGPREEICTNDWSKPARKIVGHRESGTSSTVVDPQQYRRHHQQQHQPNCQESYNHSNDDILSSPIRSSTFSLIGGPIPVDSPSNVSSKCWETEAQAAARKRKTELEQLTNKGRSNHVRGRKRRTVIMDNENNEQEAANSASFDSNDENQISVVAEQQQQNQQQNTSCNDDPRELIGFRSNFTSCCTDPNFLRDISEAVTKSNPSPLTMIKSSNLSTAPYAMDPNLPTDPYKSNDVSGERRKDLLLENFSSVVPGYTGKRTFIN